MTEALDTNVLRDIFRKGYRVRCDRMNDPQAVPSGTEGTITGVDDMGTIHVTWDNGSSLGLILGEDDFEVIGR